MKSLLLSQCWYLVLSDDTSTRKPRLLSSQWRNILGSCWIEASHPRHTHWMCLLKTYSRDSSATQLKNGRCVLPCIQNQVTHLHHHDNFLQNGWCRYGSKFPRNLFGRCGLFLAVWRYISWSRIMPGRSWLYTQTMSWALVWKSMLERRA